MTPVVNLFKEEKSVACKKENIHTGVVLSTHTPLFKSESERVLKLGGLGVRFNLPHIKL